jgi:hypothetical protein
VSHDEFVAYETSRGTGVDPSSEGGDGKLPQSVAPAALSRLVMAITQGMAMLAKAGESRWTRAGSFAMILLLRRFPIYQQFPTEVINPS